MSFLCDVARWLVKSDDSTAFSPTIWRKRNPDGDYTWEVERVWSVKLEHSTVVSCVRTCSKTHRLSCVPEGGPFFAAAAPAGARAPLKTIERYAFLKVRSASAPVPVPRKSLIFHRFALPLENREENDAFCAFARWSLLLFHWKCRCLSFFSLSFPSLFSLRFSRSLLPFVFSPFGFRSLGFHIFPGGGGSCRRQGKSAAPRGAAWVSGWFATCSCSFGRP